MGVTAIPAATPVVWGTTYVVTTEHLPGGVAATFGAVQPLIVAALAVAVLGEPPSGWRLGWGAAGVVGVVLGPDAALDPVGIAAGLAGAVSMALGVTLTKRWGRPTHLSPVGYAGWQLTAGGLLWFRGIGALPVASVAILGLLSPLVAAGLGAALLGQLLTPLQLLGFAVSLSAILGSQLPAPRRNTRAVTHEELLTKGCTS